LPRVFQEALSLEPAYVIEVLDKHFELINGVDKDKLLLHELLHIPLTFSGALRSHKGSSGKEQVSSSIVDNYYDMLVNEQRDQTTICKANLVVDYFEAPVIKARVEEIVEALGWSHIDLERVFCVWSEGSRSKQLHARCHGLPRLWQEALGIRPAYVIELLDNSFNNLSQEFRDKLLIKELLYIPKTFSGALRPHKGYVSVSIINKYYNKLVSEEGFSWV
jgi:predicted metallopeptidase